MLQYGRKAAMPLYSKRHPAKRHRDKNIITPEKINPEYNRTRKEIYVKVKI
jgi:hypothetical protein